MRLPIFISTSQLAENLIPIERIRRTDFKLTRLKAGLATSSHAIACAALYNIPTDPYLIRAERVTKLLIQFEMDELFNEDLSEAEINQLKESEKIVRRFIEWDLEGGEEDFESLLERLKEVLKVEVDVI